MAETPVSESPPPTSAPRDWMLPLALILAVLSFAGGSAMFWYVQTRLQDMEVQLARRIGEFDTSSREARSAAKEVRAGIDDLLGRVAALETRALEAQNQQLALEAMYQELARSQDERLLADVEQTLLLAEQQLHLAGNVRAAVLGLEAAEARLVRMQKPQFARLREAIAADAARLRLLPAADVVGVNARLDALVRNVDRLKLESEPEAPRLTAVPPSAGAVDWLGRLGRGAWDEIKQLVRIRRLDHPDLALLAPAQVYFLRQNLKLRLLSARLAALQRDETTYLDDLAAARSWVGEYFSRSDPLTVAMLADLAELAKTPVVLKDATVDGSLKALRASGGRKD